MRTRLDELVLVLAPVMVQARIQSGKPFEDVQDVKTLATGVVSLARTIETAIADEELRQMQPSPGMG